jgi:two-component system, OmpR family, phosphate regulon sensor histidine kinase PhoR
VNLSLSPKRIALLAASLVAVITSLSVFVFNGNMQLTALVFCIGSLVGYLVFYYFLKHFIYRKIKLIYKNLHQLNTKHILDHKKSKDPIESISKEMSDWANDQREEIALLKKQESHRSDFIGNISHELKTPIFQIQGYVHTLLEGALTDPKVNYRFLDKTSKSIDRLVELVNDLTSINQLESGMTKLSIEKFDIRELIDEVYGDVEYLVKKSGQNLGYKTGSDHHLLVKADRRRIGQVLINLIKNAITYGRKKGNIKCAVFDLDTYVLVEVTDDGDGIPLVSQSRLFERFYRVEKSRNRDSGGSGLGLSIAKHIIEAHGQSIHLRSEEGQGSTFSFTLKKVK